MSRKEIGKYICLKCNKEISLNSKTRHDKSCNGIYKVYKQSKSGNTCDFCKLEFTTPSGRGVHEFQCMSNPDRRDKTFHADHVAWNKGKNKNTDDRIHKSSLKLKDTIEKGEYIHGQCKDANKEIARRQKLSESAKRQGFGGYRENAGKSKKFKVVDSFGKETTLQSSYELKCSEILDKLKIKWNRPKAMKYSGRNYFADFYLPDYDIFLDPKNSYKAKLDANKIAAVIAENNVRLYVLLEAQITEEYLTSICRHAND